ncbi:MAG: PolC-type DNA polymerase III [Chitinophagales bacterium]
MEIKLLIDQLGCTIDEDLTGIVIDDVNVLPQSATWLINVRVNRLVSGQVWAIVEEAVVASFEEVITVKIVALPNNKREFISWILTERSEEIYRLVNGVGIDFTDTYKAEVDDEDLVFCFLDRESWHKAIDKEISSAVENWLFESYRIQVLVKTTCQEDLIEKSCCEFVPAVETPLIVIEPMAKGRGKKNENNPKQPAANSAKLSIISDLQEGERNIRIEGKVFNIVARDMKDGRKVTSYYVTDYSDSITVKMFEPPRFDKDSWISARGEIRYDSFEKDLALFADYIEPVESKTRRDEATNKRVELHLHTMMSTMDAVTDLEELMATAKDMGHESVAITDHGTVQAFPTAYKLSKQYGIKVIYGVEGYLFDGRKQDRSYHIVLLAATQSGLKNLYQLVSSSYINNFYRTPRISREELIRLRDGIMLGTACERGELVRAYLGGADDSELERIANFYDYLEIQPLGNNEFLIRDKTLSSREELMNMNQKIIELGKKIGKPVVATGDVHFLEPHHEVYRRILQAGKGFEDSESQAPLYYRTTEEMMQEFSYLDEKTALDVVVNNPRLIVDKCEKIKPVPDGRFSPQIDNAAEKLTDMVWSRAVAIYSDPLPKIVEERLKKELDSITGNGFSELYLIAVELVKKSNDDGYIVGSRGSVGSSLVACLAGITEVNPLIPHYVCRCGYTRFIDNSEASCGADLPRMDCPECGLELKRDGFDIPFETFLGFEGDKVPDIDLNFSSDYQPKAHRFVEELFGKDHVFRSGTISTIGEKTAYGFVLKYEEQFGNRFRKVERERLVKGINGVRRTTGQHPGGLIIVPNEYDIYDFCPVQHPADDAKSGVITTHFDYDALKGRLEKLDILGHDGPTVIKNLEDLTGVAASTISLNETRTMALFSGVEPLSVSSKDIESDVGTYGIPEFGTRFVRQMLEVTRPKTLSELIRICGLAHGTNVWANNAHDLIKDNVASLNQVIATRDDIMIYLIDLGFDKHEAFNIMEKVRGGKALSPEQTNKMREKGVPEWYIDSCHKIGYVFPKAHAVAYVMLSFRIAYYKVYHPLAFYASFFSIRASDFDDVIVQGYEEVKRRLKEIDKMGQGASPKDKNLVPILELALEMYARGYDFYPVDLHQSDSEEFQLRSNGLLLPFSALSGVGINAARNITAARSHGEFQSVEDLQERAHLNRNIIDILEHSGCLTGLAQTAQFSLFN